MTGRRIAELVWLATMWVLLWADITIANAVGGLLAGGLVILLVGPRASRLSSRIHPVGLMVFVAVFARELLKAVAQVTWQVVGWPNRRFREAVVAYQAGPISPGLLSILGNTISLTPGTLTLEIDEQHHVLYVHVLHLTDPDEFADGIRVLERAVVRAFASEAEAAAAEAHWKEATRP